MEQAGVSRVLPIAAPGRLLLVADWRVSLWHVSLPVGCFYFSRSGVEVFQLLGPLTWWSRWLDSVFLNVIRLLDATVWPACTFCVCRCRTWPLFFARATHDLFSCFSSARALTRPVNRLIGSPGLLFLMWFWVVHV